MSDFLTRLAARQLGRVKTIQPRLAPLFASTEPDPSADSGRPDTNEQMTPRQQGATARFPGKSSEARRMIGAPSTDTANDATLPARPPRVSVTDDAPMLGTMIEAQAVKTVDQPVEARPKLEIPVPPVGRTSRVEVRKIQEVESTTGTEPSRKSKPTLLHDKTKATPIALASFPATHSADATGPIDSPVNSLVAPKTLSPATGQYQTAASPVEPPVYVTIGRIEVTAVTASPQPKRAPVPRKPSMSLDDYLARRQRRER